MSYNNKRSAIFLPVLLALAILLGMFINSMFQDNGKGDSTIFQLPKAGSKLDVVLDMVESDYVDTVSSAHLVEQAIPAILKDLDPHTVYIPAKDLQRVNEDLKGNFGGIGVQFIRYQDTVAIVRVIPGGPSELAGIKAGDRLVTVNDTSIVGKELKDNDIIGRLKGPKGTPVTVGVYRRSTNENLEMELLRGSIPVPSVDVAYMINDSVGYIKVSRFAATTYFEFSEGLEKLESQGVKNLIVDLRGNTGGYLSEATNMINEFLAKDKMMVYTEGKAQPRTDYKSNGSGRFQDLPVIVLIDEVSASASEIFAGAIQDNDRGKIVGRRSFGKGLVQEQRRLPDGSALRLTVARYYTPTGRCIQKPYTNGKEEYYNDLNMRYIHGEFQKKDSIHFNDSLKFTTPGGNTVYGGGGIMPDVFIPVDTSGYSNYFRELARKGIIYQYAFAFVDKHREQMNDLKTHKDVLNFVKKKSIINNLVAYADKKGVKPDSKGLKQSRKIIETQLKAYIARDVIDDIGYYPIIRDLDKTLTEAETHF
ncbi:S41 family peptidase [Marinifilum caeruleilacunae]|uniref:S41 family peptidase n=1 Tax=Marinifilum caeruleilacunae TaxID=2499076 RepID=A0ABX1X102_9BACT|nr:S41 family peptidase [Marinifilum caeruleilacunae]NOU62047.1 S41 family peptidase [Marinifilum caeruleilacunae]